MLSLIASDSADDRVLVASDPVGRALCVSFGLSSLVFALTLGVLLLARCLPRLGAGDVADSLDDVSLGRVVLLQRRR